MFRQLFDRIAIASGFAALLLQSPAALAQIAVSANDGKGQLVNGVNTVPDTPVADNIAIIDLGATPPKLMAEVQVPTSLVGPPQSVAISADKSFALVTAATKLDPKDKKKTAPESKVSVIDLKASPPKVVATYDTGEGASGVAINRAGTLALVANRIEGTISVFTVSGKTLAPAGKLDLGNPKSGPSAVSFTPDGKRALVTRDGDHKISVLNVDGDKVTHSKRDIHAGLKPYPLNITADGAYAVVTNIGMGGGDSDTMSLVDLKANPPRVVDTVSVGPTPESLGVSPNGRYVAVTVMNGSNKPKDSPLYKDSGLVAIYRIAGGKLSKVTEGKVGTWCQGVGWRKDSKLIAVQCIVEQELMLLSFNGRTLKRTGSIKVKGGPAGLAVAAD
ncbi:MAG: YncE family protein [Hyphomicrobiaceae bacterium]